MNSKDLITFQKYDALVQKIDQKAEQLTKMHQKHMNCKKGCDLCCMDCSIFPVELYSILAKLKSDNVSIKAGKKPEKNICVFLKDYSCTIYEHRPVICRTHGLPLLYMNDDNEWELSSCELNFIAFDFNKFTSKNTFPQDKYNSELFMLNKEFIQEFSETEFRETDLIPLKDLAEKFTNDSL